MRNKDAARFMDPQTGEFRSAHLDADGVPQYDSTPMADALKYDPKPSMFDLVRAEVARTLAARSAEMPTMRELLEQAEFLASEDDQDETELTDYEVDRLADVINRARERERILDAVENPSRRLSPSSRRPEGDGEGAEAPERDAPPNPRAPGELPPEDR